MPWPRAHKQDTRRRIVKAAAAAFRAGGVADVRLEDIMARAGLTQGGFYAHFRSKDELVREALAESNRQTLDTLAQPLAAVAEAQRLQAVADTYLSPAHVAHPEMGCPLAALGPEIARAGGATGRRLAEEVQDRIAWMRQVRPARRRSTQTDDQVIGTLACMVGGVILARAAGRQDSAAILRACRRFLQPRTGAGRRARNTDSDRDSGPRPDEGGRVTKRSRAR